METVYLTNIRGNDNDATWDKWFFGGTDKISYLRIQKFAAELAIGKVSNILNQNKWIQWFPEPVPEPEYQSFD